MLRRCSATAKSRLHRSIPAFLGSVALPSFSDRLSYPPMLDLACLHEAAGVGGAGRGRSRAESACVMNQGHEGKRRRT